jgi:hypothetical protein
LTTGHFRDFLIQFFTERLSPIIVDDRTMGSASITSNIGVDKKKKKPSLKGKNSFSSSNKSFLMNSSTILRAIQSLNWNQLFLSPGMPNYKIDFTNSLSQIAQTFANKWISSRHSHALTDEVHFYASRPDMEVTIISSFYTL